MGVNTGRNESLGDGSRGKVSSEQLNKYNKVIHYGEVKNISDDGNMKLQVLLRGVDVNDFIIGDCEKMDENKKKRCLPWCEPLLPRMLSVCPSVGETVKVLLMDTKNPSIQREWIGPIISQPEKIKNDPYFFTGLAGKVGSFFKLGRNVNTIPEADGIYPGLNDIGLLGRNNTDVLLKDEEVLIRVGKHIIDNPLKRNEKNPGYISMRILKPSDINKGKPLNTSEQKLNLSEDRTDTVIMSNKIFLIGRDSNSKVIKPILTKEDHLSLQDNLHPIVYGDVLYEFMVIMRQWIKSHIHIGDRLPSDPSGTTVELEEWFMKNLDQRLLSTNVFVGGDVPTEKD